MKRNVKGITLIEVVLTVAIFSIVIASIYAVFFAGQNSFATSTNKGLAQESVRLAEIFLTDELKNTTSLITKDEFDTGIVNKTIYGIKYEDGYLLLSEYKYDAEKNSYDSSIVRKLKGDWNKLTISSLINGILDVSIEQKEKLYNRESTYPLEFSIKLINDNNLRNDEVWDLTSGDEIYFIKSNNTQFGQIKLIEDTGSGGSTGTGGGTTTYSSIVITNIQIVEDKNNGKTLYNEPNPTFSNNMLNIYIGQGEKKVNITLTLDKKYNDLNISLGNSPISIGDNETTVNLNNVELNNKATITISIGYKANNTENYTKTIRIIADDKPKN
ncbi:MAG: prepilin-type N-terminal cleavage/methylation domain-containing protein [Tissierellales bacterium]|nr:prepilin-type N-terminal cleavage/methylation domain-containing protein [Tissierellales bacterium]